MKIQLVIMNILTLIGIYAVYEMSRLPEIRGGGGVGPGFFPIIMGSIMIVLSLIQTISLITKRQKEETKTVSLIDMIKGSYRGYLLVFAIVIYVLLFKIIGFPVMTFIFFLFIALILEPTQKKYKVMFSFGFTMASWLIFKILLRIPLPAGILSALL